MKLFEHKTKRGVLVDETGREVTLEEIHSCRESLPQPLADLNSTLTESDTINRAKTQTKPSPSRLSVFVPQRHVSPRESSRSLRTAQRRPGVLGCVSVGEVNK